MEEDKADSSDVDFAHFGQHLLVFLSHKSKLSIENINNLLQTFWSLWDIQAVTAKQAGKKAEMIAYHYTTKKRYNCIQS